MMSKSSIAFVNLFELLRRDFLSGRQTGFVELTQCGVADRANTMQRFRRRVNRLERVAILYLRFAVIANFPYISVVAN